MKRLVIFILVLFSLVSCKQIETPDFQTFYVYNSAWNLVEKRVESRAVVPVSLKGYVDDYNATNDTDQLFVFDQEVDIMDAPEATAYIVDAITYEPIYIYTDVPRQDFIERKTAWDVDTYACGGKLFIDKIPPLPPVVEPLPDYERYAVYLIDPDGAIYYETHCVEWESEGFTSMYAMFLWAQNAARVQAYANGAGWYSVSGHLYHYSNDPILGEWQACLCLDSGEIVRGIYTAEFDFNWTAFKTSIPAEVESYNLAHPDNKAHAVWGTDKAI